MWYTNFAVMEEQVKLGAFEKRIHEIDFIRGLLMVLVVVDHIFNLLMSFNKGWAGDFAAADGKIPFKSI